MSRPVNKNIKNINLFCGYCLNEKERSVVTELALYEMTIIPIHNRKKPFKLVEEAKDIVRYKKWNELK